MVSGGAPLSVEVKNFLTVAFSVPIFECYGMTEAAGCLCSTSFWDRKGNNQGGILPCNRMQLRDVPHLNCSTEGSQPTGEIYIKGNSIFKGYYKDLETTKTVLDEQGWLKVGDIGLLHKNGAIELIERVNEFKKL